MVQSYPRTHGMNLHCTSKHFFKILPSFSVTIPIVGIQNDERYWDKPDEFRPERFSKENKHKIIHGTYLPFGLGPRNCIGKKKFKIKKTIYFIALVVISHYLLMFSGMRFALMEVKIALYSILRNFVIKPSVKTPNPIR